MWWALLALLMLLPAGVSAHPLAPVAFALEQHGSEVIATVKHPRVQPRGATFSPRFPASCETLGPATTTHQKSTMVERYRLRCPSSLVGAAFGMDGLSEADVDAVVRVTLDDGRVLQGLLDRSGDAYVVPARASAFATARSFGRAGLLHLLGGLDHVLFVLGLVLLLRRPRKVMLALTAFTAGHALSMLAATAGWIALSSRFTEVGIALTLVWLAHRVVRREQGAPELTRPYLAALGVGLVHGLGFATAFSETGMAGPGLAVALGGFHLGIEAGQLAVVTVALVALRLVSKRREALEIAAGYAIGGLAFMWLLERAVRLAA